MRYTCRVKYDILLRVIRNILVKKWFFILIWFSFTIIWKKWYFIFHKKYSCEKITFKMWTISMEQIFGTPHSEECSRIQRTQRSSSLSAQLSGGSLGPSWASCLALNNTNVFQLFALPPGKKITPRQIKPKSKFRSFTHNSNATQT